MTEELWFKSRDLTRLFARLGKPTEIVKHPVIRRKFRLFGVAAVRHSWKQAAVPDSIMHGIDVAEMFADGKASANELQAARTAIQGDRTDAVFSLVAGCVAHGDATLPYSEVWTHAFVVSPGQYDRDAILANSVACANLLRDIFGNPFRQVTFNPDWRTSTAVALSGQMYDSRDFSAMPILADALEDAGCSSDDILNHCRDPQATHVRGCWVVDLVLGKV